MASIPADMAVGSKFSAFNLIDVEYKVVNETPVPASILIPKEIGSGQRPVLVRWHGGCFITGHRFYPDWFGDWILQFALSKNAIIVTPDYRLLPEAKGIDILQDVRDFYNWLATPGNLQSYLPEGVVPDLDHLLVTGESAGGWLAIQSSLLPASRGRISAVISHYPMLDLRAPHYTASYEKHIFQPVAPQLDRSILANYLSNMNPEDVITSAVPPDRVPIVISALQQGAFGEMFGDEEILYPLEVLDSVTDLPATWILHGTEDSVVPIEGTYKYVKLLREKLPETKLHVHFDEGSEHGFDNAPDVDLEKWWVKEGLSFIGEYWPRC